MCLSDNTTNINLCEDLLAAWLSLSATIRNERLVRSMTFREVLLCNILYNEMLEGHDVTATDIVQRTGILKSQVNKIVVSMETSGLISRVSAVHDKRKLIILLTEKGKTAYLKEHQQILNILDSLLTQLGKEKITTLTAQFNEVTDTMRKIAPTHKPQT